MADTTDQITLGVQASNLAEVTQFSSTTNDVYMRMFTNNYSPSPYDNLKTGVVIGSSNYDKSASQLNNLYFGMLTGTSNIQKTMILQNDRVGISTGSPNALFQVYGSNVYSSWTSLARFEIAKPGQPVFPAFVIDANGNIGIGTEASSGNTVTLKGTLQVDSLQIGASGGSSSGPPLINAPGLQTPVYGGYLQYNDSSMCNIYNMILDNSLYTSNTIYANTYSPFQGSNTITYSNANLSNINIIYPYQIQFTNSGTAASPALTFQQNSRTGIFEAATDNLAISTSGLEALRVNPDGNVGIGSQTPRVALDVAGSIFSPYVVGSNILQTFTNIANFTFVDSFAVTITNILPTGSVTFNVTIGGNSTSYNYTLSVIKNGGGTTTINRTLTGSLRTETFSQIFASGTYNINATVTTLGTGAGASFYQAYCSAPFTVGATDPIGAPSVALTTTPLVKTAFSTTHYTYVSGVPYYSANTTITFPINSLTFTNIYNSIDPTGSPTNLTNVLYINGTAFTYAQVFTAFKTANGTNTGGTLTITLTTSTNNLLSISDVVYNVNYTSGISGTLLSGILYLGTAINESTMAIGTFAGMPINNVLRQTNTSSASPLKPALSDLSTFTGGSSISVNDAFYSPYTQYIYTSLSSLQTAISATYVPDVSLTSLSSGNHSYLSLLITTSAAMGSFVLNFTSGTLGSGYNPGITDVYIYWVSLGQWYNAKFLYTDSANKGCAAATYVYQAPGDRYPVKLPQGTTLSGSTNIYVNIHFTGPIDLSGFSITNS